MRLRLFAFLLALVPLVACAQNAGAPQQGHDYHVIRDAQALDPRPGRIEVVEVFSYACGFCAQLEPIISRWQGNLADDVDFVHLPATFGGAIDNFARGYFVAEQAGIAADVHRPMFNAFHVEGKMRQGNEREIAEFMAGFADDMDADRYLQSMKSFSMNARVNRARQFSVRTGVDGTPQIIVNGKYRVVATRDGGFDGMLRTVEHLIERERNGG